MPAPADAATPTPLPPGERVAVVHDWLNGMRGGEKVLEVLLELFPGARLYTLFHDPERLSPALRRHPVTTSSLQGLPGWKTKYRYYLPLFPWAIERMRAAGEVDLVVSTSHCVAKGFPAPDGVPHLCYVHSPMRYVWDLYDDYFGPGRAGLATRLAMRLVRRRLQRWDVASSGRVDAFLCNSRHIAAKISALYGRRAEVVPPPVDVGRYAPAPAAEVERALAAGAPFLVASALVAYKRVDLAIRAVREVGGRLVVVGRGPELERLRALAGPETEFRGWVDDAELARLYQTCRAFLFPGEEDFGITPLEAMASGRPVVAYGRGGALETVVDGATGVFFHEQHPAAMAQAIRRAEATAWDAATLRAHAEGFSRDRCRERLAAAIGAFWGAWRAGSGRAG